MKLFVDLSGGTTPPVRSDAIRRRVNLRAAFTLSASLCGLAAACISGQPVPEGPPPLSGVALNAAYVPNGGLLTGMQADGTPALWGSAADPAIAETRLFYDTLGNPAGEAFDTGDVDPTTGQPVGPHVTAPATLDDWKRVFGFPTPLPGEALQDFRDRTGVVVYYNRNELGLGRELACSKFADGHDAQGNVLEGSACYVANYGPGFRQEQVSLLAAMDGQTPRNTVCISYRPSLDPNYQVQFYVYNSSGKRQDWARLDTLGPRPHPQVCMTCHGGGYDSQKHLARNAHFLPLDPNVVLFVKGNGIPDGVTRAGQEERIRQINLLATGTPLTAVQSTMLAGLYGNSLPVAGTTATGDTTPAAWNTRSEDADFHQNVLRPYCLTCHLAGQRGLGDADVPAYQMFATPSAFDAVALESYICGSFSMPNAQPTSLGFWDTENNPGVDVAGTRFPAAADAFLARRGLNRATCNGLPQVAGCDRVSNPDSLCGGDVNGGAVCDTATDRCAPVTMPVQ